MNDGDKSGEGMIKYNILMLGNSKVGKTSFVIRFCENKFGEATVGTVGIDYKTKYIQSDGKKIKLNIIDTAGQEKFRSITKTLYKQADGIIILYDVTDPKTFEAIKEWIKGIQEKTDINRIGLLIVGNKTDLGQKVSEESECYFQEKYKVQIFKTSVKKDKNINECFIEIVEQMKRLNLGKIEGLTAKAGNESFRISNKNDKKMEKGGCCGNKKG